MESLENYKLSRNQSTGITTWPPFNTGVVYRKKYVGGLWRKGELA